MMELKMKYRMYVIPASVTVAAATFLVMVPFCSKKTMTKIDWREGMLADTTRFLQENQLKSLELEGRCLLDILLRTDSGSI